MDFTNYWAFDFNQYDSVWHILINIMFILVFIIFGNAIRRLVPFLRKAHIPSALIGGVLLLCFELILTRGCGIYNVIDKRLMQIITYHALAIGFIASTLKIAKKDQKSSFLDSVKNGAITGGTYMLQAGFGILVSLIFFWCTMSSSNAFFYDAGSLLPLGFGQGPGNALTWDLKYTEWSNEFGFNFDGNGSVGLTIASIGFIVASIVSVIYINVFKHKHQIKDQDITEERNVREFIDYDEIEDSESVDKTSIQVGLVALAYGVAVGIMALFWCIQHWTGIDPKKFDLVTLAFGFNFIWGVIAATLIKLVMKGLKKGKIIKKQYINNYQMDRISGFAFDMMILAGVASIDISDVKNYWLFILIVCVVGAVVTLIYVRLMTKICFKNFQHEAFLTNFGTLTGTASNGMTFLREIDPNFQTPMSNIFIVSQLPAMIFVAPLLFLLGPSAKTLNGCYIMVGVFFGLAALYTTFLILSPKIKFKKKETVEEPIEQ